MRRKVVVNLVNGDGFQGRRLLSWPWSVRLAEVVYAPAPAPVRREPVTLDGVITIPRHQVAWIQVNG